MRISIWMVGILLSVSFVYGADQRVYENRLTPIKDPKPLLGDHPQFVQPIKETARFEAPPLIEEEGANLAVRGWRFSYNARGIIEVPNKLRGDTTAIIIVHPWGIDDGQGWNTPEPAGVAFACCPDKNQIVRKQVATVVNPFLKEMRDKVALVMYSLPGAEDPIRQKIYRSFRAKTTKEKRAQGLAELKEKLNRFTYKGQSIPSQVTVSPEKAAVDYFRQFPGLDAGAKYNNEGFWNLPIPVIKDFDVGLDDVVIYDPDGYAALKKYLKEQGIRHVLLGGFHTDMCVCKTTAGHENLRQDFNTFLIGDCTQATFPASPTPAYATSAAVSFASLNLFVTQVSWVKLLSDKSAARK